MLFHLIRPLQWEVHLTGNRSVFGKKIKLLPSRKLQVIVYKFGLSWVFLDLKEKDAIRSNDKTFLTVAIHSQGQDGVVLSKGDGFYSIIAWV